MSDMAPMEATVEAIRQELANVEHAMECLRSEWSSDVVEMLLGWYQATMVEVVRDQYHYVAAIGPAGTLAVKSRFVEFLNASRDRIEKHLSSASFWSHAHELPHTMVPLVKGNHCEIAGSRFVSLLCEEMGTLFGRLREFLQDNGFSVPVAVAEAVGATKNLRHVLAVTGGANATAALRGYANLRQEQIQKQRRLTVLLNQRDDAIARERDVEKQQKIEVAENNAVELWDKAFEFDVYPDIDWDNAWSTAEEYGPDEDEWGDRYLDWLILLGSAERDKSFKAFLADSANSENYSRYVRRVWAVGLIKSALRQLEKSRCEPWLQQLVNGQVLTRTIPERYYESYHPVLEHYWEHLCRNCSQFSQAELCRACGNCESCCKC